MPYFKTLIIAMNERYTILLDFSIKREATFNDKCNKSSYFKLLIGNGFERNKNQF